LMNENKNVFLENIYIETRIVIIMIREI